MLCSAATPAFALFSPLMEGVEKAGTAQEINCDCSSNGSLSYYLNQRFREDGEGASCTPETK